VGYAVTGRRDASGRGSGSGSGSALGFAVTRAGGWGKILYPRSHILAGRRPEAGAEAEAGGGPLDLPRFRGH